MALHELATNAAKHGALSVDVGHVHISWYIGTGRHLTISWSESNGPEVSEPKTFGFGQKVIKEMTASSLGGTVDLHYRPEGLFWQVGFTLA
jgi:two-component sensor histidine kinase